ncbi:MAG: universal stress protein [Betaproteobacteria bacterium]|nr:universal stress protein [Betaproteobacteria bacterium]MBI3056449.1 universal stress protein [Betaproteobacteria bacterium]
MDRPPENQFTVDALGADTLKLLLPIDATARSRWGIHYAIWRKHSGRDVAVSLRFVAEPVTGWEVLRFLSQEEVRRFQAERGNYLLKDAAQPLRQAGIPMQMNYREGDIVFQILDVAEQLECDEIVLAMPYPRWGRLFYCPSISCGKSPVASAAFPSQR